MHVLLTNKEHHIEVMRLLLFTRDSLTKKIDQVVFSQSAPDGNVLIIYYIAAILEADNLLSIMFFFVVY